MPIAIDRPAEAFVGVGLLVLAADSQLSDEEAATIFDSMMSLEIFEGDAGHAARRFLGRMMEVSRSYLELNQGDLPKGALAFEPAVVDDVTTAVAAVLDPPLRETALTWAIDLAFADGFHERERAMIDRLARELDVDHRAIDRAIAAAKGKAEASQTSEVY
jgi:tellurite resistance protein